jgi:hypothetical protein
MFIKFQNDDDSFGSVLSLGVRGTLLGLVYSGSCPIVSWTLPVDMEESDDCHER